MKSLSLITLLLASTLTFAQDPASKNGNFPLTITLFSESVSLPNFHNIFKNPNLGIRLGTEIYYSKNENRQLIQAINLGYYYHKNFQNGLYLSSEFGYRKFFNKTFVDATVGVGYLLIDSALPRYELKGNDYEQIGSTFGRIMPTLGLGAGYQFNEVSVFSRYEIFGETPFGFNGVPVLPHKALHVGTRFNLK
ncbi:MAG: hypothetical protein KBF45_02975 [Cyclobacteriaceae bacterium]|jgi:hypothetical protein|nr:hypothetical protein [Cyclobacteriaceae bacterium]